MKESVIGLKAYIKPEIRVMMLAYGGQILAGSPPIKGKPQVNPIHDGGSEELGGDEEEDVPAKGFYLWED